LSVSTLIWFSGKKVSFPERCRITLQAIISNPLIIACVAGFLYASSLSDLARMHGTCKEDIREIPRNMNSGTVFFVAFFFGFL
jgi:hypothetical protein